MKRKQLFHIAKVFFVLLVAVMTIVGMMLPFFRF